jgi:protein CMS1
MADALEDDYVASDGDVGVDDESDGGSSVHSIPTKQSLGKRKADDDSVTINGDKVETEEEKRKRRKEKLKRKDKIKKAKRAAANLAVEPGAIASWPPDMQADHMRKLMRSCKQFSKMTDMELDEVGLTEKMLVETTSLSVQRIDANLSEFIRRIAPKATEQAASALKDEHDPGQPCILVITGNAQRAADLSRALRPLSPADASQPSKRIKKDEEGKTKTENDRKPSSAAVAKLFARHFKVAEQTQFLATHVCPLAVGTPQRIEDLLSHGLKLNRLQCIVLDVSWTDQKQRNLLDGIETRQALFSLFSHQAVQSRLRSPARSSESAKVVFF